MNNVRNINLIYYGIVLLTQFHKGCFTFIFYNTKLSRSEATEQCIKNGHRGLAVLDTEEVMDAFFENKDFKTNKDYWVGLQNRDENRAETGFTWDSDPSQDDAIVWAKWSTGEPNNLKAESCVRLKKHTYRLATEECSKKHYTVCQDKYDTKVRVQSTTTPSWSYKFILYNEEKLSRTKAYQKCRNDGYAGLAILNTEERLQSILGNDNFIKNKDYWVGMQQQEDPPTKNGFRWDSDESQKADTIWAKWSPGEPKHVNTETCVRIKKSHKKLATEKCSSKIYFICQEKYDNKATVQSSTPSWSYKFIIYNDKKLSRSDAYEQCIDDGYAGLANLNTMERLKTILEHDDFIKNKDYWVGMLQQKDPPTENGFRWDSDHNQDPETVWARWSSGEPNHISTETCVRIKRSQEKLATEKCSSKLYFICQEKQDGKATVQSTTPSWSYQFIIYNEKTVSRTDAYKQCIDDGYAGLAILNTEERLNSLLEDDDYQDNNEYWVGLKQQGQPPSENGFRWDSDSTSLWIRWSDGEPDKLTKSLCVRLKKTKKFGTKECTKKFNFICQGRYEETNEVSTTLIIPIVKTVHFKYVFYNKKSMSRTDAHNTCIKDGFVGLAVLNSRARMDAVLGDKDYNNGREYWVGLQQQDHKNPLENGFRWDSGETNWIEWSDNEPDSIKSDFCVRMKKIGKLGTKKCSSKYYFICQNLYFLTPTTTAFLATVKKITTSISTTSSKTSTAERPTTTLNNVPTTKTTSSKPTSGIPTSTTTTVSTTKTTTNVPITTTTPSVATNGIPTSTTTTVPTTKTTTNVPITTTPLVSTSEIPTSTTTTVSTTKTTTKVPITTTTPSVATNRIPTSTTTTVPTTKTTTDVPITTTPLVSTSEIPTSTTTTVSTTKTTTNVPITTTTPSVATNGIPTSTTTTVPTTKTTTNVPITTTPLVSTSEIPTSTTTTVSTTKTTTKVPITTTTPSVATNRIPTSTTTTVPTTKTTTDVPITTTPLVSTSEIPTSTTTTVSTTKTTTNVPITTTTPSVATNGIPTSTTTTVPTTKTTTNVPITTTPLVSTSEIPISTITTVPTAKTHTELPTTTRSLVDISEMPTSTTTARSMTTIKKILITLVSTTTNNKPHKTVINTSTKKITSTTATTTEVQSNTAVTPSLSTQSKTACLPFTNNCRLTTTSLPSFPVTTIDMTTMKSTIIKGTATTTLSTAAVGSTEVDRISSFFTILMTNAIPKPSKDPSISQLVRSEIECVLLCSRLTGCEYTVFIDLYCTTYSILSLGLSGETEIKVGAIMRKKWL